MGSVFGSTGIAAALPLEKDRVALVCRIVGEDGRKRKAAERLEKMCNPAFTGTITRAELIGLLEREGFKIVCVESWNTWVSFQQWLKPHTPRRVARQLYHQLVADRGCNTTGTCPFVERGKLFLMQGWLTVVAERQ